MKKVLILNGSPSGDNGNCAAFISKMRKINRTLDYEVIHLGEKGGPRVAGAFWAGVKKKIASCDSVIFVTGTYWDSWGSPLQRLLEEITDMEATPAVMGKPCAVMVLMHSVGGKSILSRLQGVLSTMGFLIPPMSGMVYSLVSDIALKTKNTHAKDFWQIEDAELILANLKTAMDLKIEWTTWPVDKKDPRRKWFK
ncbi:flavodoxin family protein [Bdellovibrio sp. HCB274]|uniref:flavodoxin family protein n=1 Tax=Bdellovibrio sp. HCB274 TaxID=3394361 RepID=UPI0039B5A00B